MTHAQEIKGLPSASGYERTYLCPGSWQAERGIPEEETNDAAIGDRVHRSLAGEAVELSDDEQEVRNRAKGQADDIIESVIVSSHKGFLTEKRYWLRDGYLRPVFSGKADLIVFSESVALVIDYKSLWGDHSASDRNMQLRALAVLVAKSLHVGRVVVAIIQPNRGKPVMCEYGTGELAYAEAELRASLDRANAPCAPRIPGEKQCKFCRARSRCPEALGMVSAVSSITAAVSELSGEELAENLDRAATASNIIEALEKEAKARISKDPASVPGYALKDGVEKRSVADMATLNTRLLGAGVPQSEIVAACGISIKDTTGLVRKATGKKGRQLSEAVDSVLEDCVKINVSARSLVRAVHQPELESKQFEDSADK